MSQQLEVDVRNAQLEVDVLNAQLAELKKKLEHKDTFILKYWKTMNNGLIAERKMNKELQATNTKLQVTNTELQAINTELKASNTELQAINTELKASNTELQASNTQLQIELNWYHKQCTRERSCAAELTGVIW